VLKGDIAGIILTGGMAYSELLTQTVTGYVQFIAPVRLFPGEHEMSALAEGAIRGLAGEEEIKIYK
jgi:butyrate kinase